MATIKTEYLLPCTCGHKLAVDRSQAGLSAPCPQCGAELTIPTLRGLDRLERAEPEAGQSAQDWGLRQAVIFLGCVISATALMAAAILWVTRPIYPQEYQDALIEAAGSTDDIDQMPVAALRQLWHDLQAAPEAPSVAEFRLMVEGFNLSVVMFQRRMMIAVGVLVAGVLLIGTGLMIPKAKASRG